MQPQHMGSHDHAAGSLSTHEHDPRLHLQLQRPSRLEAPLEGREAEGPDVVVVPGPATPAAGQYQLITINI